MATLDRYLYKAENILLAAKSETKDIEIYQAIDRARREIGMAIILATRAKGTAEKARAGE